MASSIKGLTIQLGAETTGLDKALSGVNKKAREAQTELKQVDRLLKFDPKNSDLIAQKQGVIAKQVEATRDKLTALRQAQAQIDAQYKNGDIGEEQYRAFQRQIIKAEQELVKLEGVGRKTAAQLALSIDAAGTKIKAVGDKIGGVGRSLTTGITLPLTAAGAIAVKLAADFEQTMNVLRVNAQASQPEMATLRDLALEMGADTVFSAGEAAQAMLELSKGGLKPAAIEAGALASTMNLAATEDMALADAAVIVVNSMNTFKLKAEETNVVVDALAAGSQATSANVVDLAAGMKYVGATAGQLKIPIADVVTELSALNQAGLDGTTSGTSLNRMYLGLFGTTKKGAQVIKDYKLEFIDANGALRSQAEIIGELEWAFGGLTDADKTRALKDLFGVEGMRAANILLAGGAKGYAALNAEVSKSGRAAEIADARMAGLAGSMERASGSVETAAQLLGEDLAPQVDAVANGVEDMANAYSALPDDMQKTILAIAEIAAVTGPVVWIFGTLTSSIGSTVKALGWVVGASAKAGASAAASGVAAGEAAVGYGALGTAAGGAAAGLETVGGAGASAGIGAGLATSAVIALGTGLQVLTAWIQRATANRMGEHFADVAQKLGLNETAARKVGKAYTYLTQGPLGFLNGALDFGSSKLRSYLKNHNNVREAIEKNGGAAGKTVTKVLGLSDAQSDLAANTQDAADATQELIRGLDGLNTDADGVEGNLRKAADAQRALEESALDAKDARKEMNDLEKAGKKGTEEWVRAQNAAQEAEQKLKDSRGENLDAIHALNNALVTGSSKTEILTGEQKRLIDELDSAQGNVAKLKEKLETVPKSKRSKIEAEIKDAEEKVERIKAKIGRLPTKKTFTYTVDVTGGGTIRAIVDGKLTQIVANREGGKYTRPTLGWISEEGDVEYVINANLLRQGDSRQMGLLAGLMKDSRMVSNPSALGSTSGSTGISGGDTIIHNHGLLAQDEYITQATKRGMMQARPNGTYMRRN